MQIPGGHELVAVGRVHSSLKRRADAPKQGNEGGPGARVEIDPAFAACAEGLAPGDAIVLLTWFHEAQRDVMKVHPRSDPRNPLMGVFATRSPDRPNPIGLHRVNVLAITEGRWLDVAPLEAIDGTPIIDIKPVLDTSNDT